MAQLRAVLEEIGYADVRTHLQSGNVLLDAGGDSPKKVAGQVSAKLSERFEFDIPVIGRTAEELADVVAADLLNGVATDATRYVVTFLDEGPDPRDVQKVSSTDYAPEQFAVRGHEVYQWYPGGQQDSALLKALAKAGVTSAGTARNWRTVTRLAEMAGVGA
jgi:uncharacterized protein (DUF1697 family)